MNRNLSNWAGIAEIASSVAVVISLVVLIVGIGENTNVTRASVYANTIDTLNEFEVATLVDPELSRIYRELFVNLQQRDDADEIARADADRMVTMIHILFRNYEKAYYTRQYGLLGEEEWSRFQRAICLNLERMRTLDRGMAGFLNIVVTQEFSSYVLATCAEEG